MGGVTLIVEHPRLAGDNETRFYLSGRKYTEEAKQAAVEGTVVLDLVVGADGRTRDIRVVSGLAHGLTQAAIEALKTCRFTPGEKDGTPVPVRVRGFKIRFVMQENH